MLSNEYKEANGRNDRKVEILNSSIKLQEDLSNYIRYDTKDDFRFVVEPDIGRVCIRHKDRLKGFFWADGISEKTLRQMMIKAQQDGHDVIVRTNE